MGIVVSWATAVTRWPPLCGQGGDDTADNLPTKQHPEVADTPDRYRLDFGVGRYRPKAGHDHVECGRKCQPANAVGYRRGGESAQ